MAKPKQQPACTHTVVEVFEGEQICCPPRNSRMWNAHPRVYLAVDPKTRSAKCYYCGTQYILKASS
ncbi:MAG: hypothetical protein CMF43_05905 [Legionellales bacterium]|nr:hypothetical protein [Legionellales bacterium]